MFVPSPRSSRARCVPALLWVAALAARPASALETEKSLTQYSHVVYQEKNGLPSDMVSAILQTRDGYLWFGTLNGLARFDGLRFTTFDPVSADAPLLHRIQALCEARDGALWVGSRGGLTRLHQGRFQSYPMPEDRRKSGIRTIVEDARGRLWARTLTDLFELRDGRLELVAPDIRSLGLDRDGAPWVTTHDGTARLTPDGVVLQRSAPRVPGEARPARRMAAPPRARAGRAAAAPRPRASDARCRRASSPRGRPRDRGRETLCRGPRARGDRPAARRDR